MINVFSRVLLLTIILSSSAFSASLIMNGQTTTIAPNQQVMWKAIIYKKDNVATTKYYLKPFVCRVWTNYVSDPGFGLEIQGVTDVFIYFKGNYPEHSKILTRGKPLIYSVSYGVLTNLYGDWPAFGVENWGCSPLDSHCSDPNNDKRIFESCVSPVS